MSYCKLILGGKERGVKFNQLALLECMRLGELNKFEPGTGQHELYSSAVMLFSGLRGNAYAKNVEEDFTWEDCTEWVENISPDEIATIVTAFQSTELYKRSAAYLADQKTADSKKKLVSKSTKAKHTKLPVVK